MEIDIDLPLTEIRIKYFGRDNFIRVQPYSYKNLAFTVKAEIGSIKDLKTRLSNGVHEEEERFILDFFQSVSNLINNRKG